MANSPQQPTVLVKKADGTMVRMTLAELETMRRSRPAAKPAGQPSKSSNLQPSTNISKPAQNQSARIENKPEAQQLKPVEQKQPLAPVMAPRTLPQTPAQKTPAQKPQEPKQPLQKIPEIKKPSAPKRPPHKAIVRNPFLKTEPKISQMWEKDDFESLLHPSPQNELPAKSGSRELATAAPVKKIFEDEAAYKLKGGENEKKLDTLIRRESAAGPVVQRPVLTDVTPPEQRKTTMSPIDEIRNFSLIDFRRLGPTAIQTAPELLKKFKVLEEESYLTYMEAVEAWKKSPLYTSYVKLLAKSLIERMPLADIVRTLDPKANLKMEEVEAVVELNSKLT